MHRLGVMAQNAEKMFPKILNEWLCNVQLFPKKSESLKHREKRLGYPYPYLVPVWKKFLDIRIRLQTHLPAGYPTGKPDSDHLCHVHCQIHQRNHLNLIFSSYLFIESKSMLPNLSLVMEFLGNVFTNFSFEKLLSHEVLVPGRSTATSNNQTQLF